VSGRLARWAVSLLRPPAGAPSRPTLVIVRHHRVYADLERPLYRLGVSARVLDGQLALFRRLGFAPVTVAEGLARLSDGGAGRWLALTFDDGYDDNVTLALPRLSAHGARATFYLTAGLMDRRRAPWWDVLAHALERARAPRAVFEADGVVIPVSTETSEARRRALAALLPAMRVPRPEQEARLSRLREALGVPDEAPCALATWERAARLAEAGMEIGAHTLHHPFLSLHSAAEQRQEIEGSVALIERRLGVRPTGLAYPGGDHDDTTVEACVASGLAYAVTTRSGDNRPGAPRFGLRRRGLSDGACLGPGGRFSSRLARAELEGAFDRLRGVEAAS
jgi:peptidoglycan/xylan/chitin deacetylase (PgdA/CDA1 family)